MSIEVRNISKTFGAFRALDDVCLHVQSGELVALLGPSGSGKTTLLRVIAGLETADAGSGAVYFQDDDVTHQHAGERKVGFVFQHYALFRHMTVFQNVAFGLQVRPRSTRPKKAEIRQRVMDLLKLVQIAPLAQRYPAQLSGGQRQRVALARAIAVEPKVLLLDEPFGALDAQVRKELRRWLRRLHDELHITSVFVTHDQEEALEVADRIVVMRSGKIEQIGTPAEVYDHPASPFVYQFLGNVNLFRGRFEEGRLKVGEVGLGIQDTSRTQGSEGVAFVRPHEVEISRQPNGQSIPARVRHFNYSGPLVHVLLARLDNADSIEAAVPREQWRELNLSLAEEVFVKISGGRVFSDDYSI